MTSTSKNNLILVVTCLILVCVMLPPVVRAQTERAQTLSVSPTLFQMSANPSQSWQSEIRVVNVNEYPMTVYPQVVNFAPSGESGTGSLIPVFSDVTQGQTLAEWVTLSQREVTILPQQTVTIPFSVAVASNAAPGGHYAAILVGTKPPTKEDNVSQVQTAQFVTALIFVRVSGDVVESGSIREFTTEQRIYPDPTVQFDVRFENTGNVHLQPQGDISITNMWGSERGVIPINYQTHFGNVLPDSIRKFSFVWTGESSIYDIGRFKAVATLGYGESTKTFTTSITYFWVIPLKQIFLILIGVGALFWFLSFAIKLYIRRMLALAGLEPTKQSRTMPKSASVYGARAHVPAKTVVIRQYETVTGPVRHSLLELIHNIKDAVALRDVMRIMFVFLVRNRLFVLFVGVLLAVVCSVVWFFTHMNSSASSYDVSIVNPDTVVSMSSDEIMYKTTPPYTLEAGETKVEPQPFTIELVNASGEPGLAAKAKRKLEAYGYEVSAMTNELGRSDTKTVIIVHPDNKQSALHISKLLQEALPSVDTGISPDVVRIYIGTDNR